ncbi:MAG: M6 family metalloprotease domain-containing protein [Elusimicrobia bacterium]|nr:M6 family metalloprotease domain-containing protein [Elusimicrobiota bacterium]
MTVFQTINQGSLKIWCLAGLMGFGPAVFGAPPSPGLGDNTGRRTCFVNRAAAVRAASARVAGAPVLPLPNYQVLVLRVQFTDRTFLPSSDPSIFFQQVRDFFSENSYGSFQPTFTLSPVFSLPQNMAFYGQNCGEDIACRTHYLIDASTEAAAVSLDFRDYGQIMIYHAGFGEESTGTSTDIWSVFYPSSELPAPIRVDGKEFDGAMIVPELERNASALGVICHEYGHQLGLPDLYDTSVPGGRSTAGAWDLMDYPWVGSPIGSNPPHLGAWSKKFLGFGTTVVTGTGTVVLGPMELAPGRSFEIYRAGSEYFLMEYRLSSAGSYDRYIPQSAGLAIWHVDENLTDPESAVFKDNEVNVPSRNGHLGVDLVEADGMGGGVGTNDGWTNGQTLSAPASNWFSGAVSSLVVGSITGVGSSAVTAQVLFLGAQSTQSVARAFSYPNPATGIVRLGAPVGTWATFHIQLSRPVDPSRLSASLFSVNGQRVAQFRGSEFGWREDLSKDNEWVFELDWNGRNDFGENVASGVYYLLYNVDGERVTKVVAVQR